jgi:hypothetical protein
MARGNGAVLGSREMARARNAPTSWVLCILAAVSAIALGMAGRGWVEPRAGIARLTAEQTVLATIVHRSSPVLDRQHGISGATAKSRAADPHDASGPGLAVLPEAFHWRTVQTSHVALDTPRRARITPAVAPPAPQARAPPPVSRV